MLEFIAVAITAVGAAGLLIVGGILALQDRTTTASAVLGFAFLFVVLLFVSKFKHIHGFGFEAEMWDEKQVQAAELVDKLSTTSVAVGQQVGLIASKLGLWSAGFTNPELADLLDQTDTMLVKADVPKQRREELLAPVYGRIELNYWSAAHQTAVNMFRTASERRQVPQGATTEERAAFEHRAKDAEASWGKLAQVSFKVRAYKEARSHHRDC
jgi:hypothetical protein